MAVALGTHANKEGRVAGINLGGGDATFPGVIGTAATKVGPLEVASTGLSEAGAAGAGFVADAVISESTTCAGYYPGAEPVTVKVVVERGTGRLLGAQIVGREGAAKRIDALAVAVWNEMTVEDLLGCRPVVCAAVLPGLGPGGGRRPASSGPAVVAGPYTRYEIAIAKNYSAATHGRPYYVRQVLARKRCYQCFGQIAF